MTEPFAGKYLLEILTQGMYSNPMHIYREYIQNASDSIDTSIKKGVLDAQSAEINITIRPENNIVYITDNGLGIPSNEVISKLMNIGASDKDGVSERGFRGIGRLGGLAYADQVKFITSYLGESIKTTMTCDCVKLQNLLSKSNNDTISVMETFQAITDITKSNEDPAEHYFEVQLINVHEQSNLLSIDEVSKYLSETAPIDFDDQQFPQANKIRTYFDNNGYHIPCYNIYFGERRKPIYKLYSRSLSTGLKKTSKSTDFIYDVEFVYENANDGSPLYIGWLAITDFSGSIADDSIRGIRLRKGNVLVGNSSTFEKFFPSEGHNANRMFAGEIHILHEGLIPNSQRDDFEPSPIYDEMKQKLSIWAGQLNTKYRRGTSQATSALKTIDALNQKQKELEKQIDNGAITSDDKRQRFEKELDNLTKKRKSAVRIVEKAVEQGTFNNNNKDRIDNILSNTSYADKQAVQLSGKITDSGYATKNDLPSSYSRAERKLYQQIIQVIDRHFINDPATSTALRNEIRAELIKGKKI